MDSEMQEKPWQRSNMWSAPDDLIAGYEISVEAMHDREWGWVLFDGRRHCVEFEAGTGYEFTGDELPAEYAVRIVGYLNMHGLPPQNESDIRTFGVKGPLTWSKTI